VQLAEKIKPVILENMRERIRRIDPTLPVDKQDIKLELSLANSKLELWRTAAIMASLGTFTDNEVRDSLGYAPLRADQRDSIVNSKANANAVADTLKGGSNRTPDYPETSESDVSHSKDEGENVYRTS
jgi:hypothetical protein